MRTHPPLHWRCRDVVRIYASTACLRCPSKTRQHIGKLHAQDVCASAFDAHAAAAALLAHGTGSRRKESLLVDALLDQTILPGSGNIIKNGNTFSKVLYVTLYSKFTRALIFQNFCQRPSSAPALTPSCPPATSRTPKPLSLCGMCATFRSSSKSAASRRIASSATCSCTTAASAVYIHYVYTYICIYIYVCMYVCMYMCVYILSIFVYI